MKRAFMLSLLVSVILMAACGGEMTYTRPSSGYYKPPPSKNIEATKAGCVVLLTDAAARGLEIQYADVDWLSNGKTREYAWEKRAGTSFGEAATVFDDATDVDIYIYDENGREICKDTKVDPIAICVHTPAWTGDFLTRIKMYKGSGCYCYGIFSD